MKNFSMPEHISPTLELDELMRLKCSLETIVSKEASDRIMSELWTLPYVLEQKLPWLIWILSSHIAIEGLIWKR